MRTSSSERTCSLQELPWRHPLDVIGDRDLMVIAPHPDDESLGCGGLLAWAAATRRRPRVMFLTDGEGSHRDSPSYPPARLAAMRRQEARDACAVLGVSAQHLSFLGLPDTGLHSLDKARAARVARDLRDWVTRSPRAAVCVTALADPHADHVAANHLIKQAMEGLYGHRLFVYPVWSQLPTEHVATWPEGAGWRVDIALYRSLKERAVACHASQHGELIHDAEEAFVLPQQLLRQLCQDYEVLLDAHF